ncbi:4021_t:CDS:2 [Funneliformis geosporum]|uniref:12676_t:CDS:1 n=1 Tax=Funneliformis geosporum TaxID=1117311 RepID=A0A9W4SM13_9GLOM|nr:12676_t:CDS:2 [Funneliformis geosporum]CAI2184275.1 4021_t:CDS:2 [Funneliformis geosporum]
MSLMTFTLNNIRRNCQHKARPHRCGLGNIWSSGVEGIVFVENEGSYSVALSRDSTTLIVKNPSHLNILLIDLGQLDNRPILTETIVPEF